VSRVKNWEEKSAMLTKIRQWLAPPSFPGNEEKNVQARTMHTVGLYFFGVLILASGVIVPLFTEHKVENWAILSLLVILYGFSRYLMFRGQLTFATVLIATSGWFLFAGLVLFAGGITSSMMFAIIAVTIAFGWLFQAQIRNVFLVISLVFGLGLAIFQQNGGMLPQFFTYSPIETWFLFASALVFVSSVINLTVRNLQEALVRERQQNEARQRAEITLIASEKRFRALVENSMDEISILGTDGLLLYESPSTNPPLGYQPNQFLHQNMFELMHPDDRQRIETKFSQLVDNPSLFYRDQFRLRHHNGNWIWVEAVGTNLLAEPSVGGIVINYHDITARKQAESALRASEEKYRLMIEQISDVVWQVSPDFRFTYISPADERQRGYTEAEVLGRSIFEFMTPASAAQIKALAAARQTQQRANRKVEPALDEIEQIRKDGQHIWTSIITNPQLDSEGNLVGFQGVTRDITERKLMNEALAESEQRYRSLFENASIGIFHSLPEGRFLRVNPALAALFGYASPEDMVSQVTNISAQIYFDSKKREENVAETLKNELWFHTENRYRHRDGSLIIANLAARKVLNPDGSLAYLEGFVDNITERKRAEEALRKSEEHYHLIFKHAPVGILSVNSQGNILEVNPAALTILGSPSAEDTKKINLLTFPPLVSVGISAAIQRCFQTGEISTIEAAYTSKWGKNIFIRCQATPITDPDQKISLAQLILEDITERKHAEELIQQSEIKYRELFQVNKDGITIFIISADETTQTFVELNQAAHTMLGYTQDEMLQIAPNLLEPGITDEQIRLRKTELQTKSVTNFETILAHKDGHQVYAEFTSQLIQYDGHLAVMNLIRDISERKQAEIQIKKALAEKETLLRELHHRTKNNMSVIIALLDLQATEIDDERLQAAFSETQNRIRSMALVHQKLYEARNLSQINLKDYIGDLAELLLESYRVAPGKLSLRLDLEDVLVVIDTAIPCGLIVNELISNALKHAFPKARTGEIRIKLSRSESGEIQLTIADNGVGLPPGYDFRTEGHFGLQNILSLAEGQLRGKISFDARQGVSCQLKFKDNFYQPRI